MRIGGPAAISPATLRVCIAHSNFAASSLAGVRPALPRKSPSMATPSAQQTAFVRFLLRRGKGPSRSRFTLLAATALALPLSRAAIDREALVHRHDVHVTRIDHESPLSVGNGDFAFT